MAQPQPQTWLCPIDGLVRMPYGTTCPKFKDGTCENIARAHITGQTYLTKKPDSDKVTSIGIAQISDEGA